MGPDRLSIQAFLDDLEASFRQASQRGEVASYIPELATVDPGYFGISVCLPDGSVLSAGDTQKPFSIQSISKVFSLAIALGREGDRLWKRVGREPSNFAFNSVVELEMEQGRPRNPFVNAGAIVTTDAILSGRTPKETLAELLLFVRAACGDDEVYINQRVAEAENRTGHRNYALAHFLKSCSNLNSPCDRVLGTYFHQCAIEMSCQQLAAAGRFLAGFHPDFDMIGEPHVRSINALMMTAGHYDGSGEFAYSVGIPAKSGVGGGILAVVPRRASIAVWSPGLDRYGNSHLGTLALEKLSRFTGWSLFEVARV